jgi:hypothetical protein
MPRGIDPSTDRSLKSSVDAAVPATLRGSGPAPSDAIVFPPPPDRGVGVAPSGVDSSLPR